MMGKIYEDYYLDIDGVLDIFNPTKLLQELLELALLQLLK